MNREYEIMEEGYDTSTGMEYCSNGHFTIGDLPKDLDFS